MSISDNTIYTASNKYQKRFSIDAIKYNLPDFFMDYKDNMYLKVTYNGDDDTIYDILVFSKDDDTEIKDLTVENFKKLFDVSYGKKINNVTWGNTVNLLNLEENQIYLYKAMEITNSAPKINNDINANCLIFTRRTKKGKQDKWAKDISMGTYLKSNAIGFSYDGFQTDDTYEILY